MLRPSAGETLRAWLLSALVVHGAVAGNPDAKRLYDDLLSNYNKLVRPVVNTSDVLRVCIKLKLSQLIDVQESGGNIDEKQRKSETKTCLTCLKMEENFRFQREFNTSLLEQMKNMLGQLTALIGLLNDLLNCKNEINIKELPMMLSKMMGNFAGSNVHNQESDIPYILRYLAPMAGKSANIVRFGGDIFKESLRSGDSEKVFKQCHANVVKNVSSIFYPRKHESIYYMSQTELDQIKEKHLRKEMESFISDVKFTCCCQSRGCCPERKDRGDNSESIYSNFSVNSNPYNLNMKISKGSYARKLEMKRKEKKAEKQEKRMKHLNDDFNNGMGDFMRNDDGHRDGGEAQMKENSNKFGNSEIVDVFKKGNELRNVRESLSLLEAGESGENDDVISGSNEDNAIKISSPAFSGMNLKNQIMTTNLWVEQSWYDYKLRWDPKEYGGVHMLHVPSDHIWRPDIVLYNNADGNYEVTLMTKARVSHTGLVEWQPPAVYKSSCAIDVEFFPYDIQTCVLKLGSWTYDGFKVDLRHMDEKAGSNVVEVGVDLSEFYMSVEWDILEVPAVRNEKFYTCCDEPYLDITFNITMRRKTLFYTVNIIIPCMGISFLTVLTFYLPSDSGEKVTLSISILISLHVFFLLVVEIIPPTSLVVPLLGKYLIFAMILVSISICVTVVVLNVHFRSPQTHKMAPWVKRVFIHILPRLLVMRRPQYHYESHRFMSRRVLMKKVKGKEVQTSYWPYPYQTTASAEEPKSRDTDRMLTAQRTLSKEDFSPESIADGRPVFGGSCQIHGPPQSESEELSYSGAGGGGSEGEDLKSPTIQNPAFSHSMCPPDVHKTCFCVRFIAEHTKMLEDSTKVKEDWKYVAMVLDRLFLWIFTLAVLVGTAGIILQAPTLYDDRIPIDKQFAEIQTSTVIRCPPQ